MLLFFAATQVRLGMTNPPYMLAQLPQIAAALKHPNVFAFLHVPVQSGSDPVRCELTYLFLVSSVVVLSNIPRFRSFYFANLKRRSNVFLHRTISRWACILHDVCISGAPPNEP